MITEDRRAPGCPVLFLSCSKSSPEKEILKRRGKFKAVRIWGLTGPHYIYREEERQTSWDSGDRLPQCRDPSPSHCSCHLITHRYSRGKEKSFEGWKFFLCWTITEWVLHLLDATKDHNFSTLVFVVVSSGQVMIIIVILTGVKIIFYSTPVAVILFPALLQTSKVFNVLLYPVKSCNLVQNSQVTWNSTGTATINIKKTWNDKVFIWPSWEILHCPGLEPADRIRWGGKRREEEGEEQKIN